MYTFCVLGRHHFIVQSQRMHRRHVSITYFVLFKNVAKTKCTKYFCLFSLRIKCCSGYRKINGTCAGMCDILKMSKKWRNSLNDILNVYLIYKYPVSRVNCLLYKLWKPSKYLIYLVIHIHVLNINMSNKKIENINNCLKPSQSN